MLSEAERLEREAFVSGLAGSTVVGCLVPMLVLPAALTLQASLRALLQLRHAGMSGGPLPTLRSSGFTGAQGQSDERGRTRSNGQQQEQQQLTSSPWLLVLEAIVVMSLLFVMTQPPEGLSATAGLVLLIVCAVVCDLNLRRRADATHHTAWRLSQAQNFFEARKNFITVFRGGAMLMTIISILAVDFRCFPRTHAKTETFGTGLMDLGVGIFIASSGITSRWARSHSRWAHRGSAVDFQRGGSAKDALWAQAQWGIPLVLGVLRLVVLKALNYQEHVTEYGEHWNFFLTIGGVWALSTVLHRVVAPPLVAPVAVVILLLHQLLLSASGGAFTTWVLSGSRDGSFFAANREGILSLGPCTGLYLLVEDISRRSFFSSISRKHIVELWRYKFLKLGTLAMALWVARGLVAALVQPTSRRLCNLAYVLWVLATSTTLLVALGLADLFATTIPNSRVLDALNRSQLPTFIIANLATGLVNLSMDTIGASDATAGLVLTMYLVAVILASVLLDQRFVATGRSKASSAKSR